MRGFLTLTITLTINVYCLLFTVYGFFDSLEQRRTDKVRNLHTLVAKARILSRKVVSG